MQYKLLLVDDDKEVLQLNAKYLSAQGYTVKISSHPSAVCRIITEYQPDCILLDVMMPEIDGFTLCPQIRAITNVPIIFLSGKTSEEDRIRGLVLEADDYIVKPYSLRELSVRIQANIRRHNIQPVNSLLIYPPLSIDTMKHKVYYNEEEIILTNREYELLFLLVDNKNTILSFEDIANKTWGTYTESDRRSIMVNASRLRKKLDAYPGLGQMIETVWAQGYRFNTK